MLKSTCCPELDAYRKLTGGQLSVADTETLLRHLETCDSCAGKIHTLPASDLLIDWLGQIKSSASASDEKQLMPLMERLIQLAKPSASPSVVLPSTLRFSCSGCGKPLRVKAEAAGKKVKCPHCGQVIPAPPVAGTGGSGVAPVGSVGMETVDLASAAGGTSKASPPSETPTLAAGPSGKERELCSFLAPAQMADELGRLGSYRVLQVLGAGGMGVVFRAEDPQLQRAVALKAMLPALAANESARQRFLREARLAASLKHDHVVTIHQVGEDRGAPFLAMEFLDGESLEDRLKREGQLPLAEVLRIGREIADGLEAAHEHGLIHRDIKPANVWLEGKRGRVKILDFGLARSSGEDVHLTQSGAIVGTPAYMPPEQARGEKVDSRCDLYSLGCVLYRLCTGQLPFKGDNTMSLLLALATEQPKSVRELNADVPPMLADLIMCLLAKDAAQRLATASEVGEALRAIAEEAPSQRETKPQPSANRRPRSQRRWLWLAAAALLLLGVGGAYFVYQIVIIRDKDGDEVARLKVPPGGSIHIEPPTLDKQDKKPKAAVVAPFEEKAKLPAPPAASPLDALDPARIPASERFDWQPKELVAVIGEHRQRHWGGTYSSIAVSPDGATVATGGTDGAVRFWDAATLEARGVSERYWDWMRDVAYVPAGARKGLVWWAGRGEVGLLDPKTGRLNPLGRDWVLPTGVAGNNVVLYIAVSADGSRLAYTGTFPSVLVWDVGGEKPKRLAEFKTAAQIHLRGISLSPDGSVLAYLPSQKEVRLVALNRPGMPEAGLLRPEQWLSRVQFSPNGERLATSAFDGATTLWDLAGKEAVKRAAFKLPGASLTSLAFSPDGKRLAAALTWGAQVWDVERPEPAHLRTIKAPTTRCAFTSNGRCLITTHEKQNMVRRWELGDSEAAERPKLAPERSFAVHDDLRERGERMQLSPDGRRLAGRTLDGRVRLWDLGGPQPRECQSWHGGPILGFPTAFNSAGTLLATYQGEQPFLQLWEVADGEPRGSDRYRSVVNQMLKAFSPDGRRAFGLECKEAARLVVWDASGAVLRRTATADLGADLRENFPFSRWLHLSAEGQTLVFNTGGEVQVWDVRGEQPRRQALLHKGEWVRDTALSPDGKTLACSLASKVVMWDLTAAEPRPLDTLNNFDAESLCFTADGKRLLWSDSGGGRLVLWNLAEQRPAREWRLPGYVTQLAIPRDGRHIVTLNSNGTIYVLRLVQK